jgi:4-aminobutyrate aminotransferase-like enzyme
MLDTTAQAMRSAASAIADHGTHLFPSVKPYYAEPLVLAEGEGVWVRDVGGTEYLDLFCGILTTGVGHCHPAIVEAVREQAGRLGHTSTLYVTEPQVEAAKRLAAIAPGALQKTFFTNSGTEAIETAIMTARLFTGRTEIVALRLGYHGRSMMATTLTAHAPWRPLATPVAGFTHALSPYPYRCPFRQPCDESCVERFARDVEEVIRTTTNGRPAAFIAETIQGVGGYIVPPPGYFQRVAEIIRAYGGLLIIDEVQAGFGRTGQHWFGIEHWGVEPDIMVMAKGIASGLPVGATIARPEIAAAWTAKTISTFGGNPISMAAMVATLDVMKEENVPARSAERGAQLRAGLLALQDRFPWIGDVRGMGLMQAIEIVRDPASKEPDGARALALHNATREERVLVGLGGLFGNVIRIGPSMLITEEEAAEGIARFGRACERADRAASV